MVLWSRLVVAAEFFELPPTWLFCGGVWGAGVGWQVAKFGIFSPAVIIAKIVLGEQKLNKVRQRTGSTTVCRPTADVMLSKPSGGSSSAAGGKWL